MFARAHGVGPHIERTISPVFPFSLHSSRTLLRGTTSQLAPLRLLHSKLTSSSTAQDNMPKRHRSVRHASGLARHPNSAVGSKRQQAEEGEEKGKGRGTFRFWHEERRFKGPGDKCIVQQALFEAGGVRTGGHPKASPLPGPLGYQRPSDWDMLWTPARLALKAVANIKPGQLVSCFPGLMSLTRKRKLSLTLKEALGEAAFAIVPRTFSLPEELPAWRAWLDQQQQQGQQQAQSRAAEDGQPSQHAQPDGSHGGSGDGELWILKTSQHLGKGLRLLPAQQAVEEAETPRGPKQKPYVLAQQYVADPLLIDGRKFGIRVWVLVTGVSPYRAYLHGNGLVLFSTDGYDVASWGGDSGAEAVGRGHVTNYAQNVDGTVWDLDMLRQHLGEGRYCQLWGRIQRSTALTMAAAMRHCREEHEALRVPPGCTFELLGLDFLVDSSLHPWLLEVNGTPSLAVDHEDPGLEGLIHRQKMGMVRDMVSLLNCRERFRPRYTALRLAAKMRAAAASTSATDVAEGGEAGGEGGGSRAARGASCSRMVGGASPGLTGRRALLARRVKEQLVSTSDEAVAKRVGAELANRGRFEPLMTLFPMDTSGQGEGDGEAGCPQERQQQHVGIGVLAASGGVLAAPPQPSSSSSQDSEQQGPEDHDQDCTGGGPSLMAVDEGGRGAGASGCLWDASCSPSPSASGASSSWALLAAPLDYGLPPQQARIPWDRRDRELQAQLREAQAEAGALGQA